MTFRRCNYTTICDALDVTRPTLTRWTQQGCPFERSGRKFFFDIGKVWRWKVDHEVGKLVVDQDMLGAGNHVGGDALARYRTIKADAAFFDLEIKRGQYMLRDEYIKLMRETGDYLRRTFETLPKEIGIKISRVRDPELIADIIQAEINKILQSFVENAEKAQKEAELDDGASQD